MTCGCGELSMYPPGASAERRWRSAERQAVASGIPLFDVIQDAEDYPSLEKAAGKLPEVCGADSQA